ncbi:hypothetical protein [Paraburkholderia dinghuensis]|uniref:Glycosyltransferase RgtA/B/C/D-like domain-containing protein n=1 Tax=Paraburkholderia dinghuensis TaxID=2305225 RepID=A0A3N6P443_9BURK|nr:hypothetical protein [Paraburkholderia dinghuensis]RQH08393.1 hypothetical protein D1Y85_05095 [Paraburkholderia dinghuensis]
MLRAIFFAITIAGGVLFWLAPHPPMSDLPQHAAQVAMLHDLLLGQSPWQQLLRVNLFTPYLLAYGLATALSFLMPVAAAIKLVLTLSFYGFVATWCAFRRRFHADERLDWLCLPGFFGFAYEYGFFPYLVAVPVGMVFLLTALDYVEQPSFRRGIVLFLLGVALFFSHGLVFLFVSAIGAAFLLVGNYRDWRRVGRLVWPYVMLAALCFVYGFLHRGVDLMPIYPFKVIWGINPLVRLVSATTLPWGIAPAAWMPAATVFMLAAPFSMSARWSGRGMACVPLAIVVLVLFFVPVFAINTFFLFHRFALFLLPFYALNFRCAGPPDEDRQAARRLATLTEFALAAVCVAFLYTQGLRAMRFALESADFDIIATKVEPAQRALNVVFDKASPAAGNGVIYENFALWYQADHRGLVDFNAASFPNTIVRYRLNALPAVRPSDVAPTPFFKTFDWNRHQGWLYRYFFVRHTSPIPDGFFANRDCRVVLLTTEHDWSVYETQSCHHE